MLKHYVLFGKSHFCYIIFIYCFTSFIFVISASCIVWHKFFPSILFTIWPGSLFLVPLCLCRIEGISVSSGLIYHLTQVIFGTSTLCIVCMSHFCYIILMYCLTWFTFLLLHHILFCLYFPFLHSTCLPSGWSILVTSSLFIAWFGSFLSLLFHFSFSLGHSWCFHLMYCLARIIFVTSSSFIVSPALFFFFLHLHHVSFVVNFPTNDLQPRWCSG